MQHAPLIMPMHGIVAQPTKRKHDLSVFTVYARPPIAHRLSGSIQMSAFHF
jgi:hypothetical protein